MDDERILIRQKRILPCLLRFRVPHDFCRRMECHVVRDGVCRAVGGACHVNINRMWWD